MIKLLKIYQLLSEDWLEVHENRAETRNNLRLSQITILTFSQFYFKINRNQLEIVVKATYGLDPSKYVEILHEIFWVRSLVKGRFSLHSNSRDVDEIKGLLISIDFRNRNTKLLLLFSIIFPCINNIFVCCNLKGIKYLTRLQRGLSHLYEHKFQNNF